MKNWTKEEIKILQKYYPSLGTRVQDFLPGRSLYSIAHKATRTGIKFQDLVNGKSGYLDIETSQLQGDFGFMYSWFIKTMDEDEYYHGVVTAEEIRSGILDKRIVAELVETLKKYKRIFTFYGSRFDIPFSRTRALAHGLKFVPYGLIQHKDLWFLARRILKMHRYRLENVCDLIGVKGKTHLDPKIWVMANTGNTASLQYILKHNKVDVEILEKVHSKLKEYEAVSRRYM